MSEKFLEAIDVTPHSYTEMKKMPLPFELRGGKKVNLFWTFATFGLFLLDPIFGFLSAAGQTVWVLRSNKSTKGQARKYFIRGNNALKGKDYKEALENYNTSLEIFPEAKGILPMIGDIYFKIGAVNKGLDCYKTYLNERPQDDMTRVKLFLIVFKLGMYKEVLILFESLPEDLAHDYLLSILKAFALLNMDKTGQAHKTLKAVPTKELEGEGKDVPLNYLLGRIYLNTKDFDKAKGYLELVEEKNPTFYDTPDLIKSI